MPLEDRSEMASVHPDEHKRRYPKKSAMPEPVIEVTDHSPNALAKQVGGGHYKSLAIQPAEYVYKNNIDYLAGNAIKYLTRYKQKNGAEDIKKARHYCDLILEIVYGQK